MIVHANRYTKNSVEKNKKASSEKYCGSPPVEPQQTFFQCSNSMSACLSKAVAVSYGTVGSVGAVATLLLMLLVHNCLGLKGEEELETGDAQGVVGDAIGDKTGIPGVSFAMGKVGGLCAKPVEDPGLTKGVEVDDPSAAFFDKPTKAPKTSDVLGASIELTSYGSDSSMTRML